MAGVPLECVCLCGDSPANPPAKGSVARTPTAQPPESSVRGSLLQLLAGVAAAWAAEITRSPDKAAAKAARTAAAEVRALLALWLPEGLTGAASAAR